MSRKAFEAALEAYGNSVADLMQAIPAGEPLPPAIIGIATRMKLTIIYDAIVAERDAAVERLAALDRAAEDERFRNP